MPVSGQKEFNPYTSFSATLQGNERNTVVSLIPLQNRVEGKPIMETINAFEIVCLNNQQGRALVINTRIEGVFILYYKSRTKHSENSGSMVAEGRSR
jgi:hypothetical protein